MSKKLYNQFATSFMLPEHTEALEQHDKALKEQEQQHIPEFDDQQLELWEQILQKSLLERKRIKVSHLEDSGPLTIEGVVTGVKPHLKHLYIVDSSETNHIISLDKIINIEE